MTLEKALKILVLYKNVDPEAKRIIDDIKAMKKIIIRRVLKNEIN